MSATIHELPKRIVVKAYSVNHQVEVSSQGRTLNARLIDISQRGARIAVERGRELLYAMGQSVGLNIRLTDKGVESGAVPGNVNWVQPGEIEVAFARPLGISPREIQTVVG